MAYANLRERRKAGRRASALWRKRHPARARLVQKNSRRNGKCAKERLGRAGAKMRVLTHYGPSGILRCSWPDCQVTDIDMLTLDHVKDDGAKQRKARGYGTGSRMYRVLERDGYPPGFQTLCCNHQLKKHLMLVRKVAEARYPTVIIARSKRVFSRAECRRRRQRALGKKPSLKTRIKQAKSQRRRARRPGEQALLVSRSLKGAAAWKARWGRMTEGEKQTIRDKISQALKISWAERLNAPR
jgi:hypothetical protein